MTNNDNQKLEKVLLFFSFSNDDSFLLTDSTKNSCSSSSWNSSDFLILLRVILTGLEEIFEIRNFFF